MSRFGFIGGAYQAQAFSADAQVCMNLFVERVESGAGKNDLCLLGTPGLSAFTTLPDQPNRSNGLWQMQVSGQAQRSFAVSGSTLYEVASNGTPTALGNVGNDGKPVSLANSSIQLMIASAGQGFCYTFSTGILTGPIATLAGVTQFEYADGFFIATIGGTPRIFVSPVLDGINWDPASTAIVSVFPDIIISSLVTQRQLCLFGQKQSVCYYDSGNIFPYDVVPGGYSEQGSAATFGVCKADNTVFGIWADMLGGGVAFRAQGYILQRISTHAIEEAWRQYSTIADAVAYSYQEAGHTFVVWYFPTANATWAYDVATGLWHQRGFYNGHSFDAHRSCSHMFFYGKHLVGDPKSGTIYQMSQPVSDGAGGWNFVTDFGNQKRWMRRSPYVGQAGIWNYVDALEFIMDVGLGPAVALTDGAGLPRDPQAMLRFSKDGGHNWSNERLLNMGQIGKFGTRVISRRFGKFWGSAGMIFELSGSDPVPIRLTDADLTGTPEMAPVKRLPARLREQA